MTSRNGCSSFRAKTNVATPPCPQFLLMWGGGLSKPVLFGVFLILMIAGGISSVGFISTALRVTVTMSEPADELYAGGTVEFCLLVVGTARWSAG